LREELKFSSILNFLNQLECDFPVSEWKLFGFHIWPIIRISLGFKLSYQNFFTEKNQLTTSDSSIFSDSFDTFYRSISNSISDSKKNQNANKAYEIVFLNVSSTRYYKLGKEWFNPFSDSFIGHLEKDNINSLVLEYPDETKIPRYRKSRFIGAGINLMNLNVLFQKNFEKINFSDLREFNNFLSFIQLKSDFFSAKILRVFNYSIYFEKILKKVKPSVVIVEGFYSYTAMGLLLAARKQNIKCIDVQHGVQSENDFLFSKWTNIPKGGYELLPDIFWCWSNTEKENIDNWTSKFDEKYSSFTGGNPVLELDESNESIRLFSREISSIKETHPDSINILYTHQAAFEISKMVLGAIKNSPSNWKWWIRFHPQYKEAQIKVITQLSNYKFSNTIVENVANYPLPLLLKNMDLHVTESSSSVLEADMLGVPSIITDRSGAELFTKQIESGIAAYSSDEKCFFKDAEALLSIKDIRNKNNNEEYFKSGIEMLKVLVKEKKSI